MVSTSQYFPRVMHRLLGGSVPLTGLYILQGMSLLFLGTIMFLVLLISSSTLTDKLQWSFLLLFASIPFFVPTSWAHYFVFLPGFQAWMVFAIKKAGGWLPKLSFLLLVISMVLSSSLFFIVFDHRQLYAAGGFVFWSDFLMIIAAFLIVVPQLKFLDILNSIKQQWLQGILIKVEK